MKLYYYCSKVAAKEVENAPVSLFSHFAGLKRQMKGHVIETVFAYGNTKPDEFYNLVVSFKNPSVKFIKIGITANFGGFSANLENYEGFESRIEVMEIVEILKNHLNTEVE